MRYEPEGRSQTALDVVGDRATLARTGGGTARPGSGVPRRGGRCPSSGQRSRRRFTAGPSRSLPGTTPQSANMQVRAICRVMSDPCGSIGEARPRYLHDSGVRMKAGCECQVRTEWIPPHSASLPCLGRAHMRRTRTRHRWLIAARNRDRIAQVHAASLPRSVLLLGHSVLDKQETPSPARDKASTTAQTVLGVERGRYTECA